MEGDGSARLLEEVGIGVMNMMATYKIPGGEDKTGDDSSLREAGMR